MPDVAIDRQMVRRSSYNNLPLLAFLLSLAALISRPVLGNSSGPEPKTTGGFQENTCVRCHTVHGLNDGRVLGGLFTIDGIPRNYEPGHAYTLSLMIAHPGQSRWGFELTARFADSGKQAGTLAPVDAMIQVKADSDILYAMHTSAGSRKGEKDGPVVFRVNWMAPSAPGGLILFNAAGNAADGSDSPAGDYIYTAGNFSKPPSRAQSEPEILEVSPAPVEAPKRLQETSRIVDLPSPVDLKKGTVEILIQHRFMGSFGQDGVGPGSAFGIDFGANMNIGVNYAATDRLSLGIARARDSQIVELSGNYEIRTARESKWKVSLRGGVEGRQNFRKEHSPFVQVANAFDYKRIRFNVVPAVVFNSRPESLLNNFNRPRAINPNRDYTISLGLGTDIVLSRKFSLISEYVPRLAGFGGLDERRDQVAGGFIIRTWGHVFTIMVSSSKDFTPSKYGVNAESRDVSLGFNIYRRIR